MANIFLDTNFLIHRLQVKSEQENLNSFVGNSLYVSPLSFHVYCYVTKIKIPNEKVIDQMEQLQIVDLTQTILERAMQGPTNDLEDNIQLHSASEAGCDMFLTFDKELLKLTFFGSMRIAMQVNR